MKANQNNATLNALFNAAFGASVLDTAVFNAGVAVTAIDAKIALAAGYLAADSGIKDIAKATAKMEHFVDLAAPIFDKANANAAKPNNNGKRTKYEQGIYLKANAKYAYYFGEGKSNKANQLAAKKATKKASELNVWQSIVIEYLTAHPRKAHEVANFLGLQAD